MEAQPPIIIPYTPIDITPNTYSMAILISAACSGTALPKIVSVRPQGMTALVMSAVVMANPGPMINSHLLGVSGMKSSLVNIFTPSAKGCRKPPGPALLGPNLS